MQIDCCEAAVIIGGIIIDTHVRIAAGRVDRALILPFRYFTAAALLLHSSENVEELTDAPLLCAVGDGVQLCERRADEA